MAFAPPHIKVKSLRGTRRQVGVGKLGVPELGFFLQPCPAHPRPPGISLGWGHSRTKWPLGLPRVPRSSALRFV